MKLQLTIEGGSPDVYSYRAIIEKGLDLEVPPEVGQTVQVSAPGDNPYHETELRRFAISDVFVDADRSEFVVRAQGVEVGAVYELTRFWEELERNEEGWKVRRLFLKTEEDINTPTKRELKNFAQKSSLPDHEALIREE